MGSKEKLFHYKFWSNFVFSTRINVFLTNVVWINVANSLDYLISVSIGCLPDFSSLGYVEDLVQNIFTGTTFPEKNAIEKLVHIKFWSNLFHQDKKG